MQFNIDNSSGRAVYQQIIDQIKRDIAMGKLLAGEKLPTVRELAVQLVINPNTIAKAYRQLEQEGIITTRPGAGAFVAQMSSNLSRAVKKKMICERLELAAVEAIHMQIDKKTFGEWFENVLKKFKFSQDQGKSNE
ncbi:MAG: GntR family transcriptional regulator [Planctomycetota bacterium]